MTDILAFAAATAPTFALMAWISRRYAQQIDLPGRSTAFYVAWLLVCAGVPAGVGILAAWAVL